jgi:hypothetical protein
MHGYWFLLFLLYAVLLVPYPRRLSSEELWGGIHNNTRKLAWAASITLAAAAAVWIVLDDAVEDWVWISFIVASLLWIPSLYIGRRAQTIALSLVVLSILPMFYYVQGLLYIAVSWMLFHALVVDLIIWTGMWDTPPVYIPLETQTQVTELRLW